MKNSTESLADILLRASALQRERETENNWSKIDAVLEQIVLKVHTEEGAEDTLRVLDLVLLALQSNRSKLSGSGCKALAKLSGLLRGKMQPFLPVILPALISAAKKANRVISGRAIGALAALSDSCPMDSTLKYLESLKTSQNKMVKLAVIEVASRIRHKEKEAASILGFFSSDGQLEVRARAKEYIQKKKQARNAQSPEPEAPRQVPSHISPVYHTPRKQLLIKSTGVGVVVRSTVRSYLTDTTAGIEQRRALKPGYSLERIGRRLEEHKKEVEEVLKKTPHKGKRPRDPESTPLHAVKKEKEKEKEDAETLHEKPENDISNISQTLINLSITHTENTDIVQEEDPQDSIFGTEREKNQCIAGDFIRKCTAAGHLEVQIQSRFQDTARIPVPEPDQELGSIHIEEEPPEQENEDKRSRSLDEAQDLEYTMIDPGLFVTRNAIRKDK